MTGSLKKSVVLGSLATQSHHHLRSKNKM